VAYINIIGGPSKRERSECHDSDVHEAGVIKFAGGTIRLWGCGTMPLRYGTGVRGYFRDSVQFRTESVRVRPSRVLGVFLYIYIYIYIYISIYLIDVNLN
jgi:hypothetical protein